MKRSLYRPFFLAILFLALLGCGDNDMTISDCFPFACLPETAAPSVRTGGASEVTTESAILNGHVNPNWKDTGAWFDWGKTPELSSFTEVGHQFLGSGDRTFAVSTQLSGLEGQTTYYYRVSAYNLLGRSEGNIKSFTTR